MDFSNLFDKLKEIVINKDDAKDGDENGDKSDAPSTLLELAKQSGKLTLEETAFDYPSVTIAPKRRGALLTLVEEDVKEDSGDESDPYSDDDDA